MAKDRPPDGLARQAPVEKPHPGTDAELRRRLRGGPKGKTRIGNGSLADQLAEGVASGSVRTVEDTAPARTQNPVADPVAAERHPFGIVEEPREEQAAPPAEIEAPPEQPAAAKELTPEETEILQREVGAFGGKRSFEGYVGRLNKVAGVEAQLSRVHTPKRREGLEKRLQAERFDAIRSLESKVQEILDTQLPGKYPTPVELLDPETDKPTEKQTSKKKQRISEFLRAGTKINLDPNKDYLQREAYATALHRRNELQYRLSGGDNTVQKELAKWKTLLAKMDAAMGIRENPLKLSVFEIPSGFEFKPPREAAKPSEKPDKRAAGSVEGEKAERENAERRKTRKRGRKKDKGSGDTTPKRAYADSSLEDDERDFKLKHNMARPDIPPPVGKPVEGAEASPAGAKEVGDYNWGEYFPQAGEPPADLPTAETSAPPAAPEVSGVGSAEPPEPPEPPKGAEAPLPGDKREEPEVPKGPPESPPYPDAQRESGIRRWFRETIGARIKSKWINIETKRFLFRENKIWEYYNNKIAERMPELDERNAEIAALEKKIAGFDERVKNVERLRGGSFAGRDLSRIGAERDEYNTRLLRLRNERDRIQSKVESTIAHRSAWESKRNRIAAGAIDRVGRELAPYETRMAEIQAEKEQYDLEIANFKEQRTRFEGRLEELRKELENVDFSFERDEINDLIDECRDDIAAMDRHIEDRMKWRADHEVKLARTADKARVWQDMQAEFARVTQRTGVEVEQPAARGGEEYHRRGPEVRVPGARPPTEAPRETPPPGAPPTPETPKAETEESAEIEEAEAPEGETRAAEREVRLTPDKYLEEFFKYYRSNFPFTRADYRRANPDLQMNGEYSVDELGGGIRYTALLLSREGRRVPGNLDPILRQMRAILQPIERT
jgi:hypothetical protein